MENHTSARTPRTPRRASQILRNVAHPEPDHVPEVPAVETGTPRAATCSISRLQPEQAVVVASTGVTQVLSGDLTEHAGASMKLRHMLAAEEQRIEGELRQSEEMLLRDLHGIASRSPAARREVEETAAARKEAEELRVQELQRHVQIHARQKLEAEGRALELTEKIESLRLEAERKVIDFFQTSPLTLWTAPLNHLTSQACCLPRVHRIQKFDKCRCKPRTLSNCTRKLSRGQEQT